MKKVLLIHNIFWSHYKAKVFSELNKACQVENFDFEVLQVSLNEKRRDHMGDIDTTIHNYPYQIIEKEINYEKINQFKLAFKLMKKIYQVKPDVVVLPGYDSVSSWILSVFLKFYKIKFINICDSTFKDKLRNNGIKKLFKGFILNLSDLVFCYGEASKQYLLYLGIPPEKIHIRIQATNNELIRDKVEGIKENSSFQRQYLPKEYFLFVGRLSEEKNLFRLITSFKAVLTKIPKLDLLIIGEGHLSDDISKYIEEHGLHDNITLLHGKKTEELIPYYFYCRALILPSTSEPWGIVVNEAMLCERPVLVSTHCGSSFELIKEGINGFSFNPYSIVEMQQSMEKMMAIDDAQYANMCLSSLSIIEDYTPEKAASMMLNGICKVVKQ